MTRLKFQVRLAGISTKPGKDSGDAPETTLKFTGQLDVGTAARLFQMQVNPLVEVTLKEVQGRFDTPEAERPNADPPAD